MTKSHEVLKKTIAGCGAKSIASDMGLSQSLIYKWCQPSGNPEASGAENPLDRILEICRLSGDESPINWLCEQTGSFRVKNAPPQKNRSSSVLDNSQSILKEFSDVLEAVTQSYAHEQRIDPEEAARIRKEWEELKCIAETFVNACEQGTFDHTD